MKQFKKIKINKNYVVNLYDEIKINYKEILKDYKKVFNKKDIKKSFLKQRLFARFLSFRTLSSLRFIEILHEIENKLKKKIYLAPLMYIRICPPNLMYDRNHKKAYFYTEPHYDKYDFPKKSLSAWIPLKKTSKKSGSLSYIKQDKNTLALFSKKKKNRFNIKNYLRMHDTIDNLIKKKNRPVYCNVGDILLFNEDVLHGATHPINQTRLSLNFQITFETKKKVFKKEKYFFSNKFLLEKNLINLKKFGDYKFYKKNKNLYQEVFSKCKNKKLKKYHSLIKNKKLKKTDLFEDVHWTREKI